MKKKIVTNMKVTFLWKNTVWAQKKHEPLESVKL